MVTHYTTSESLFLGLDKYQRKIAAVNVERIMRYFRSLGSFGLRFYVSLRRIAERTRLTLKTVHKWVRRMVAAGMIRIPIKGKNNKRGASGLANVYSLVSRVIHNSNTTPKREKLINDEEIRELCDLRSQCLSALSVNQATNNMNESKEWHCSIAHRGLEDLEDLEDSATTVIEDKMFLCEPHKGRDYWKGNRFFAELERQYEATKDAPYHPTIKRLLDSGKTLEQVKDIVSEWYDLRWIPTPEHKPRCCRCKNQFRLKVNLQSWTDSFGKVFWGCPKCRMVRPIFWESKQYEYHKVYYG